MTMPTPATAAHSAASAPTYWLGFDTGGTFTDAAILDGERRVVATAKSLTTHWDLSIGIAGAIRAVRPWAVDVASGVESSPGVKDAARMARFVAAVREVRLP